MTAKLTASADGSKVLIGTAAEDALQIDATAKTIKALSPYFISAGIGVNQSWVNRTGTRALNTDYPNNTGKAIQVSVQATANALSAPGSLFILISGVAIHGGSAKVAGDICAVVATIPVGATYKALFTSSVTASSLINWAELV